MTEIDIRATKPDEWRAASDAMAGALLTKPIDDETWDKRLSSWEQTVSYSAWRADECVGHAAYFPFTTAVPGGARLPSGGVTRVGVRQTARRLGVASLLMNQLTEVAAESGLALLSLRASEAVIYRRFGYGIAGDFAAVKIDTARARPLRGRIADGTFRMLIADEVLAVVPPLYERHGLRRPGTITRPESFYTRYFAGVIERSESEYVVVHTSSDGVDDGYVHYSNKWTDATMFEQRGTGEVLEVIGADDSVELALWQYLFDVDLVAEWSSEERPLDDLVRGALHDPRAYRYAGVFDEQWVRLIDVDSALRARAYQPVRGSVVIEISDPRLATNNGRWRIDASGAVRDDQATPDLVAPIESISAAYLGGRRWWELVATGQATAASAGAGDTADALFAVPRAPFCGSFF